MDEFISKDKAIKLLENLGGCDAKDEYSKGYDEAILAAIYDVRVTKPADVQPVKRGKWEELTDYGGWGDTHYRCSVCGEEWYLEDGTPQQNNMNFCPRCGSRMDGDAE